MFLRGEFVSLCLCTAISVTECDAVASHAARRPRALRDAVSARGGVRAVRRTSALPCGHPSALPVTPGDARGGGGPTWERGRTAARTSGSSDAGPGSQGRHASGRGDRAASMGPATAPAPGHVRSAPSGPGHGSGRPDRVGRPLWRATPCFESPVRVRHGLRARLRGGTGVRHGPGLCGTGTTTPSVPPASGAGPVLRGPRRAPRACARTRRRTVSAALRSPPGEQADRVHPVRLPTRVPRAELIGPAGTRDAVREDRARPGARTARAPLSTGSGTGGSAGSRSGHCRPSSPQHSNSRKVHGACTDPRTASARR